MSSVQQQPIVEVGPHDVLCGRGAKANNNEGNVLFRNLIKQHKVRYIAASKNDKPNVAREVVKIWRNQIPSGRFLMRDAGKSQGDKEVWYDIGDSKAREKTSQCLRERTPDVIPYLKKIRAGSPKVSDESKDVEMRREIDRDSGRTPPLASPLSPSSQHSNVIPTMIPINPNIFRYPYHIQPTLITANNPTIADTARIAAMQSIINHSTSPMLQHGPGIPAIPAINGANFSTEELAKALQSIRQLENSIKILSNNYTHAAIQSLAGAAAMDPNAVAAAKEVLGASRLPNPGGNTAKAKARNVKNSRTA